MYWNAIYVFPDITKAAYFQWKNAGVIRTERVFQVIYISFWIFFS